MIRERATSLETSRARERSFLIDHATTNPYAISQANTVKNVAPAFQNEKVPVRIAATAKRKVRDVVNKPSDPDPGFNALDKNDDGFISRAEARGNPFLEKRFKSADSNHDGKLSRAEYLAVMTKKDLSTAKAKTEHAFDKPASKDSSR